MPRREITGLYDPSRPPPNPKGRPPSKLSVQAVREIKHLHKHLHMNQKEIREYMKKKGVHVSQSMLSMIINNQRWTHVKD